MTEFSDLCYLPLDLPLAPKINGIELIRRANFKKSENNNIDAWHTYPLRWTGKHRDHFRMMYHFESPWRWVDLSAATSAELRPLMDYVEREIPYRRLTYAVLLQNIEAGVLPHLDFIPLPPEIMRMQPANYRILVEGELFPSLFVCENLAGDGLRYAELPTTTNTFVLNAQAFHGAVHRNPKCILFLAGEVDEARHYDLLRRSREKYQAQEITFASLSQGVKSFREENRHAPKFDESKASRIYY